VLQKGVRSATPGWRRLGLAADKVSGDVLSTASTHRVISLPRSKWVAFRRNAQLRSKMTRSGY